MGKTETRIAEFIVETDAAAIPADSYRAAREGCFDCVGVTLAGAVQPHGRMIVDFAVTEGGAGNGECTVLGAGVRTSASMAALANGTLGHALDFDDMGGFGHPSVALLPAALAMGEREGASGRDVLAAYVIGFEVGRHLSRGAHYIQGERGFHSTAVFGTLAATATACRLLGLDQQQTIMALGIAGSMPGGVVQNFGTHTKPLHAGQIGRNSVTAALLARSGYLASDIIVESKVGWAAAYLGQGNYDPAAMVRDLGAIWTSTDTIVIKKYPCCGSNHSALDSLLALRREYGFQLDDVLEVEVAGLPAISHVLLYPEPSSAFQGKFSLHYALATALVDGRVDIGSFDAGQLDRPALREALTKIAVNVLSNWDPAYEAHPTENPVTVRLKDGRVLRRSTNRHHMHGTPSDPLSADELQAKFRANARLSLAESDVEDAMQRWWTLDQQPDIRTATRAVAGGVPAIA
jgi:2-methylcitrate dehydratase PrpD